mgnify:CR=1 FL=1
MRLTLIGALALAALPAMAQKVITADVLVTDIAPLQDIRWQRAQQHSPKYPLAMAKAGAQGCAVVSFNIDKNGKPGDIDIKQAVPAKAVSRSTRRLVKELEYVATTADTTPQQRTIRIDYCIEDGVSELSVEQQCLQRTQYTCG